MWKITKDWISINLYNIISIDWERKKVMNGIKGVFVPLKRYFKFTRKYAPFMFCNHKGKLLSIVSHDVQWKDKYNTPRHEENPLLSIALFNMFFFNWYWGLSKNFEPIDTDDYWEQALWYLYYASYNKEKKGYDDLDINKAKETWPWQCVGSTNSTWKDKFIL